MSKPRRSPNGGTTTRREFAKALALLAAAPAAMASAAGQEAESDKPDPLADTAKALTDIVRGRYGKYLSEEQLRAVQRRIHGSLRSGELLRQFKLTNADEPAVTFRADVP